MSPASFDTSPHAFLRLLVRLEVNFARRQMRRPRSLFVRLTRLAKFALSVELIRRAWDDDGAPPLEASRDEHDGGENAQTRGQIPLGLAAFSVRSKAEHRLDPLWPERRHG